MSELVSREEKVLPRDLITYRVGENDIDQYGHVNYLAYPKFMEVGQDFFMLERGITFRSIEELYGLRSFVKVIKAEYMGQAFQGDNLIISTEISKIGNTSLTFQQSLLKEGTSIVEYEMVVVLVDTIGIPTKIPDDIRNKLQSKNIRP